MTASSIETLEAIRASCLAWVRDIRDDSAPDSGRYKYNRHMIRPYAVEATTNVVMILWLLEALDGHADKANIVRFLKSVQDPATGYFHDPLIDDGELAYSAGVHSWQHIWDHHTNVCDIALRLCGEAPLYPLPTSSHADLDAVDAAAWTQSLDWTHPYLVAEEWMMTVVAYLRKHADEPNAADLPAVRATFAAMEAVLDPDSGMPVRLVKENPGGGEGLGGIFKLLFAYVTCGRPYPYADAAVRTILSLQSEAGDFAGANMCMNWDALVALRYLTNDLRDTSRRPEILQAAERLVERLCRDFRKPDGGFSFFHNTCLPNHNSVRVSAYYPESDVLGTAMCLDCLSLVDAWRDGRPGRSFLDVYYTLMD
jgi:hypothetical protein